ncbi:TetR/AcrR family transcriptional regulator [Kineosporia sp. J2-2]|uniref:TetR/AcrR family transcriptional regulator n=1 Tax=Kineosporia corallincola TaxID=2835133 RepID=A0ABS5TTR4_9ACTN|nr:TetR/AcrR family transcriptional regulator [Kineosporia corallincola]MBT0774187.1 TetR/AcrR family transcriptional regulator [Kineosporia corallincola]
MTQTPPLRRDAEDNRKRLLSAARDVFSEQGLDATLHDVARRAGVGVGTAYRRFANKEVLFDAILSEQVAELEAILHAALEDPDPWHGLVSYMEQSLAIQARDRGMAQILSGRRITPEQHDWERDRLAPLVDAVANRATRHGVARPELTGSDLILLQIGIVSIAFTLRKNADAVDRADVPELWRRYLAMALDGIRADSGHRALPLESVRGEELHRILSRPDRLR